MATNINKWWIRQKSVHKLLSIDKSLFTQCANFQRPLGRPARMLRTYCNGANDERNAKITTTKIADIVGLSVLRVLLLTGEALHHGGPQSGNFPSLAVSIGADVLGVRKPLRVVVRRGPTGVGRVEEPHENRVGVCCIGGGCILRLARQHYVHAANLV